MQGLDPLCSALPGFPTTPHQPHNVTCLYALLLADYTCPRTFSSASLQHAECTDTEFCTTSRESGVATSGCQCPEAKPNCPMRFVKQGSGAAPLAGINARCQVRFALAACCMLCTLLCPLLIHNPSYSPASGCHAARRV